MNDLRLMLIAAQASHIASNAAHTSGPHHGYATKSACGTEAEVMQQQQIMHTGASSTRQLHSSLVQVREREREREREICLRKSNPEGGSASAYTTELPCFLHVGMETCKHDCMSACSNSPVS